MDVSVIIVSFNVQYFIEQCLLSVIAASKNLKVEIIVVDNNSSDNTCSIISEKYPEVNLIGNQENVGFTKANNLAAKVANGKYLLILNPDTVIAEDCLKQLVELYNNRSNLGVTGVKLIDGGGFYAPESKRGIPTPHATFNKLFGISSKRTGKYYATHLNENESGVVDVLSGSFMFLKKSAFNEVKGFDESFFMYGEDIDLCYRMKLKGYQNYYLASTSVIHYKGESTQKDIKYLKYFNGAMNIFYRKHFKLNLMYDFVMRIGIKFWFLLKYLKFKFKKDPSTEIKKIQFFKKGEIVMFCLNKKFLLVNEDEKISSIQKKIADNGIDTIVFDNNTVLNKIIISKIERLKNEGVSFKIRPRDTNFIIGSPCPKNKGEVKLISL